MEKEWLSIAQCLEAHPTLSEKVAYKIKYINVLEYFVDKYSNDNIFSKEMLNIYKEKLLGSVIYNYNVTDIKNAAKGATGIKFKGYKLFTYRYNLLFDCFFINAFDDRKKAFIILPEIKNIFHSRYHKKIDQLFEVLYNSISIDGYDILNYQLQCWRRNKDYFSKNLRKILITANMSAGKSTLINTLVGKKVNKTQNDACTAKIHYIFNKPYEDGYSYEWDYKLNLNSDLKILMEDDPNNKENEIGVGTYFRTDANSKERICIIDTPGVNSSLDERHRDLSYRVIEGSDYDILVCVLNASNIGTYDDQKHLQYLANTVKDKKIIFVINQLDKFDKEEDSIEECVAKVQQDISSYGFNNACVCPISAYAGLLAKKQLHNELLTDVEKIELQMFILKFKDSYSIMRKYFVFDDEEITEPKNEETLDDKCFGLLKRAGIINLEKILFE